MIRRSESSGSPCTKALFRAGAPGPLEPGETMICVQRHTHDRRVPHLHRTWATRPGKRASILKFNPERISTKNL